MDVSINFVSAWSEISTSPILTRAISRIFKVATFLTVVHGNSTVSGIEYGVTFNIYGWVCTKRSNIYGFAAEFEELSRNCVNRSNHLNKSRTIEAAIVFCKQTKGLSNIVFTRQVYLAVKKTFQSISYTDCIFEPMNNRYNNHQTLNHDSVRLEVDLLVQYRIQNQTKAVKCTLKTLLP